MSWLQQKRQSLLPQVSEEVVKQSNTLEWTFESHWWARDIYKNTPDGSYLSYDYVYKYQPVLEKRLYYAGVRLGNLIQDIFGNIK